MISAVAEMYNIHPQTLRLYEREGLLIPSRSNGNTRLYAPEDLEQLETILNLTRDLGVNLAGIEIILNMRRRMRAMQEEMQAFVDHVQKEFLQRSGSGPRGNSECPSPHRSAANHSRPRWLEVGAPRCRTAFHIHNFQFFWSQRFLLKPYHLSTLDARSTTFGRLQPHPNRK